MFKELLWYVGDNRFSDIVEKIEQSALEYEENFEQSAPEHKSAKKNFHKLVNFHAKKSGYLKKLESQGAFNPDTYFFKNGKIDRKNLDSFEKEVVKNHMYQKHLWDFMGTTSSFGIITKLALSSAGKSLDDYIPASYPRASEKSPISPILEAEKGSAPIYLYSDGTLSTLYDRNLSRLSFDTTTDESGFDWTRTGYDPNYTVSSKTEIVYDSKNDCYTTRKRTSDDRPLQQVSIFHREKAKPLTLSLIKSEDGAILLDPFYIFLYKRIKNILLKAEKEEEEEIQEEVLSFIDTSLMYLGMDKVTKLVLPPGEKEDKQVLKFYKDVLGDRASAKLSFISLDDAKKQEQVSLTKKSEGDEVASVQMLTSRISHLMSLGLAGDGLVKALETDKMLQPMNSKSFSDLESLNLSESDINHIKFYDMDESAQKKFDIAFFNLYDIYPLIQDSMSRTQFADEIYQQVVKNNKSNRNIEISTTLKGLLTLSSKVFDNQPSAPVRRAFESEIAAVPSEKLSVKVKNALENAVLRFHIIKDALQMTERQVVSSVVQIFEQGSVNNVIVYAKSSDPINQRLIFRYPMESIIAASLNLDEKLALKTIDYSAIGSEKGFLPDETAVEKYLSGRKLKDSGIDKATFISLLSTIREQNSLTASPLTFTDDLSLPISQRAIDFGSVKTSMSITDIISPEGESSLSLAPTSIVKPFAYTDGVATIPASAKKFPLDDAVLLENAKVSFKKPDIQNTQTLDELVFKDYEASESQISSPLFESENSQMPLTNNLSYNDDISQNVQSQPNKPMYSREDVVSRKLQNNKITEDVTQSQSLAAEQEDAVYEDLQGDVTLENASYATAYNKIKGGLSKKTSRSRSSAAQSAYSQSSSQSSAAQSAYSQSEGLSEAAQSAYSQSEGLSEAADSAYSSAATEASQTEEQEQPADLQIPEEQELMSSRPSRPVKTLPINPKDAYTANFIKETTISYNSQIESEFMILDSMKSFATLPNIE